MRISIIIPCHNEERSVAACVASCLRQSRPPDQVLVINDGSTDRSAEILREFGDRIDVVTIPVATGNKSHAQEQGLRYMTGDVFIATDGDTILDEDFVRCIEQDFLERPEIVAVGGYVKSLKYNWITACRELDYVIGQDLFKMAQASLGSMFVIPGCAGAFRADIFRRYIRFDHDTLTEDLDFTYKFHELYFPIHYDRRAVAYTQDPATIKQYVNQMRRWYSGGWQNLAKHIGVLSKPNNALQLSMTYIEGFVFSILLFLFPLLNISVFLYFLIPYIIVVFSIGTYAAIVRRRPDLFFVAPGYLLLLYINAGVFLEQFWKEIVRRERNLVWFHPARREINPAI